MFFGDDTSFDIFREEYEKVKDLDNKKISVYSPSDKAIEKLNKEISFKEKDILVMKLLLYPYAPLIIKLYDIFPFLSIEIREGDPYPNDPL